MNLGIYACKSAFSQTYQFDMFVRSAKRASKIPFSLRENRFNTFWWTESFSPILQISRCTALSPALCTLASLLLPRLPSSRPFSCSCAGHRGWDWPDREYPVTDSQWAHPSPVRFHQFPPSRHVKELSVALRPRKSPQPSNGARQTADGPFRTPRSSLQRHRGCRHHNPGHLRFSRRHCRRLDSQEAPRATFLCSFDFQRGTKRFESGNGIESRQCASLLWSLGFPGTGSGEAPFYGRFHSHSGSTRRSFLRQNNRGILRRKAAQICHCRSDVPAVEEQDGRSTIPPLRAGLGGSRVLLHSVPLENRAPLRGRAPACGSGVRRDPDPAVHFQALHLSPSFGNQLEVDSRSGLAFVLRPRISGTAAAGVQGFLCYGEDSYTQLLGECHLHGDDPVGLRLGPGLPVSVFAQGGPALEHLHASARVVVAAGRVGQTWNQQYTLASGEVSRTGTVYENPDRCFES